MKVIKKALIKVKAQTMRIYVYSNFGSRDSFLILMEIFELPSKETRHNKRQEIRDYPKSQVIPKTLSILLRNLPFPCKYDGTHALRHH
jgi:hypothetical protein